MRPKYTIQNFGSSIYSWEKHMQGVKIAHDCSCNTIYAIQTLCLEFESSSQQKTSWEGAHEEIINIKMTWAQTTIMEQKLEP